MFTLAAALAALPLGIWTYLVWARGGFWREPDRLAADSPDPGTARHIVAIIPARDEAPVIGSAVQSLLRQHLPGSLHVIVVDDSSSDGTGAVAAAGAAALGASAHLSVVRATPPPPGWTGKLWAMAQGVDAAAALQPDYLLFTDADIHHDPDSIAALVASAEVSGSDLTSRMVTLSTTTFAERALIPAFVFYFFMLYPPTWIGAPGRRTAGAAGGCMLVRPAALARSGGLARIRSHIIDDCALAAAMKAAGCSISLALTRRSRSIRSYGSFAGVGRMISRSAFNQLQHSYTRLAAALAGLLVTFLAPPLLIATGRLLPAVLGACAWLLMCLAYRPMVRFYGESLLWTVSLPLITLFYAGATLHSALQFALGRGGRWKDRMQDQGV